MLVGTGKPAKAPLADLPQPARTSWPWRWSISVPAGQYGKEALISLKLWNKVEAQVAQADNVRAALKLVATGEAPLASSMQRCVAEPGVGVVAAFPADSHAPITYPAAANSNADTPQAAVFLDSLSKEPARSIFISQGFTVTQ
ncbi:MAG: molybdate ABC transporter substrate-binding protein [Paracoccus sp. (in: a-proteobacteria)]